MRGRRGSAGGDLQPQDAVLDGGYLRAVWDRSADALVLSDRNGVVLAANQAYYDLYGLSPHDVIGRDFARIFPEERRTSAQQEYARIFTGPEGASHVESIVRRSDGSERVVQTRYTFIERDGSRALLLSAVRDVTSLKQGEEAVRAQMAALVASSSDAIIGKTIEGRITSWNAAAERLYGYSAAEAIGQPITLIVPAERVQEQLEILNGLQRGERVQHFETVRQHRDGHLLDVSVAISPILDSMGQVVGASTIARDISARADLDRTRAGVVASVSHDLKSPLTVILGHAQFLARQAARGQPANGSWLQDGLARIETTARKMDRLLDELGDMARLQTGASLELHLAPVDLVALLRGCIDEYQQMTDRHVIELEAAVPALEGEWDATRLERVAGNLLSNAIKYSPAGGLVRVQAREVVKGGRRWAVLSVTDRGIGIPAADLAHVGEQFHRAGNVVGRFYGSGLGLAGATHIAEQHGGTLSLTSTEGEGTTVTVLLPLADGAAAPR